MRLAFNLAPMYFRVRKKSNSPSFWSSKSNWVIKRGKTDSISALARDWPMQFRFPAENGRKELFMAGVASSQRSGINSSGFSKTFSLRIITYVGSKQMAPLGIVSPWYTNARPVDRAERTAVTGITRILSLTTHFIYSTLCHSSGGHCLSSFRNRSATRLCLANSTKVEASVYPVVSCPATRNVMISAIRSQSVWKWSCSAIRRITVLFGDLWGLARYSCRRRAPTDCTFRQCS